MIFLIFGLPSAGKSFLIKLLKAFYFVHSEDGVTLPQLRGRDGKWFSVNYKELYIWTLGSEHLTDDFTFADTAKDLLLEANRLRKYKKVFVFTLIEYFSILHLDSEE